MFLRSFVNGLYSFLCYWIPFAHTSWIFTSLVIRDIDFFSGKVLLVPATAEGSESKQNFPCLLPPRGGSESVQGSDRRGGLVVLLIP